MNTVENVLGGPFVKAIYLTLLHSLWEGAVIAVIVAFIMAVTKKSTAALRYNLLLGSLLLFVIGVGYTFAKQYGHPAGDISPGKVLPALTGGSIAQSSHDSNTPGFTGRLTTFLNEHAGIIVAIWFMITLAKSVQLLTGLSGVIKLKNQEIYPLDVYWEQRVRHLAARLGISSYVSMFQSGIAKVPLTLGYFKPMILVPVGLLGAIPQDQVEAIILHELAHIRRKDYLVNILQSVVEIIFFFNPAVSWLSSLIRNERENCCDDLAVGKASSKLDYVKALISFEEFQSSVPTYALAMTGPKNHIISRAKRILNNHNKTLNTMEKIILTSGLVLTCLVIVACTQVETQKNRFITTPTTIPGMMAAEKADSSFLNAKTEIRKEFPKNVTLTDTIEGKGYRLKTDNTKVIELSVNDEDIAADKIGNYKKVTDQMIVDFWTKVALINATGKKIMGTAVSFRDSLQKTQAQLKASMDSNQAAVKRNAKSIGK
jgi:bla regulator protein blaR1